MRARLFLLALSLALAACGTIEQRSGGGPASTSAVEEPTRSEEEEEEALRPPAILLASAAGTQEGVPGSSCVHTAGVGICSDTDEPDPGQLSVVRPGETVRVSVAGAEAATGKLRILPLGCSAALLSIPLAGATTRWTVELDPGLYELDVFVGSFETPWSTGDASASLGLLVDESAPLELVPAPAGRCQSR